MNVFDASYSEKAREWKNLRRIVHVHKKTLHTKTGKISHSDRLYISDIYEQDAKKFHEGIRGHWQIENNLHWVKDVIQNEDKNGVQKRNGPVNVSTLNSLALNIHRIFGEKSLTTSQMIFCADLKLVLKTLRT